MPTRTSPCHGGINPSAPAESGLVLADGWLTIGELSDLRPPPGAARFAFLSACHTGSANVSLPDEAITMAAAMRARRVPTRDSQPLGCSRFDHVPHCPQRLRMFWPVNLMRTVTRRSPAPCTAPSANCATPDTAPITGHHTSMWAHDPLVGRPRTDQRTGGREAHIRGTASAPQMIRCQRGSSRTSDGLFADLIPPVASSRDLAWVLTRCPRTGAAGQGPGLVGEVAGSEALNGLWTPQAEVPAALALVLPRPDSCQPIFA